MAADLVQLETKLAAARTRLILEKPFLGALVMHLPLKAADAEWCDTTATDARNFYFNPDYIARLTLEQTQFVLAHEAMHCALSHFARRGHRQKHRWDVACDYAVNMILDDERMQGPENALMSAAYRGLTAEEIYPLLHEDRFLAIALRNANKLSFDMVIEQIAGYLLHDQRGTETAVTSSLDHRVQEQPVRPDHIPDS